MLDKEIKEALFSMNSSKAPSMDGFNVFFYKHCWNIIGASVTEAVQDFFRSGYMPNQIDCTYVSLIPKVAHATSIKDYRPIACCSALYKIVSKVLTNLMQSVMGDLVGKSQSAFVKGRVIFDNILLSHELVKGYGRNHISPRCMLKIDLQKAYDSVEWPFIKHLLLELGFPDQFGLCPGFYHALR